MTITRIEPETGLIWYNYKQDEVAWNGYAYLSLGCDGSFQDLDTLDRFWSSYEESRKNEELNKQMIKT